MTDSQETPWAGAVLTYAGWVPNVRSHLSFSVIGASRHAEAYTRAYGGSPTRLVLALQKRVSNDYPWPTFYMACRRPDLVHHWLLEGVTQSTLIPQTDEKGEVRGEPDRQGMLRGRLHVIPNDHENKEGAKRQRKLVKELRKSLMLAPHRPTNDELDSLHASVVEHVNEAVDRVEIEFALMRTGELRLWYRDGAGLALEPHDLGLIAEQAYFFVKDVVHDHTHHDPSSDQITPLTRIVENPKDPHHSSDIGWRRETLWSLSREVERLNRDGGLIGLRRSIGMIAHAEAFQQSLMGHVRDPIGSTKFRREPQVYDYDFKHLKESIRASIEVAATKKTQAVQLAIAFIATLLSGVSVASSLQSAHNSALARNAGVAPQDVLQFTSGGALISLLVWNPFLSGIIIATLMLGIASACLADGEAGLYNRAQRVTSQLARAASVSLADSERKQLIIDWLLHVLACVLAFAAVLGCLAIIVLTMGTS